jgi:hypothetical protein
MCRESSCVAFIESSGGKKEKRAEDRRITKISQNVYGICRYVPMKLVKR